MVITLIHGYTIYVRCEHMVAFSGMCAMHVLDLGFFELMHRLLCIYKELRSLALFALGISSVAGKQN